MKKIIIGSLIGAILLFGWQSLSWTALHIHDDAYQYTSSQETLLTTLKNNLPNEGQYILPSIPPNSSPDAMDSLSRKMNGNPWAIISYHKSYEYDMVMPIVRGFLIALVCVLLVCLVIQKFAKKSFISIFGSVLTFGLVSFLFVWYNQHNWFHTPWSILNGELIDNLVGWGLCGLWLGWWYSRKKRIVVN